MALIYRRRDARWKIHQATSPLGVPNLVTRIKEDDFFAFSAKELPIDSCGVDRLERYIFVDVLQSFVVRREGFPSRYLTMSNQRCASEALKGSIPSRLSLLS
jgi:hypothetical protein